jgi:hypothetical protein
MRKTAFQTTRRTRTVQHHLRVISRVESQWTKRLLNSKLPWNEADKASFAFALALRAIVNEKLDDDTARELFGKIAKLYPQFHIHPNIPRRALG